MFSPLCLRVMKKQHKHEPSAECDDAFNFTRVAQSLDKTISKTRTRLKTQLQRQAEMRRAALFHTREFALAEGRGRIPMLRGQSAWTGCDNGESPVGVTAEPRG